MPLYEYFCKSCDGVFEAMGKVTTASVAAPCPVCAKKAERIPPTSFSAFTMREGYPRSIPDRGTYWHLGQEVKRPVTGSARMNEHPEINKPQPKRQKSKGELEIIADRRNVESKDRARARRDGVPEIIDNTKRSASDD